MKNILKYILFGVVIFVLLTLWDLLSGVGMNLASNALQSLLITLIYWGYGFYQNKKKDAQ